MKDALGVLTCWLLSALMVFALWQIVGCASHKPVNADDFSYTLRHEDRYFTKGEDDGMATY